MTRLFHISDLHFGAEDSAALAWFAGCVAAERPDAVIVTGDLTMRARSREFAAAQIWLQRLAVPISVQVGNHDLPNVNLLARFAAPYRRFRALEAAIATPLELDGVAIVPLVTTARFQLRLNWSKGYVSTASLASTLREVAAHDPARRLFVAAHHPLIEAGTRTRGATRRGSEALSALAGAGVEAVLTGHVHDPFDITHTIAGRGIRLIGAGTLSERVRASAPSFNAITVRDERLTVDVRLMPPGGR